MAQPTTYNRQNSFTALAAANPSDPYTGTQLDAEFNALKVTIDGVLANLALIQSDEGDLANQSVGPDQLSAAFSIGINPPSKWLTATAYTQYDTVFNGTTLYRCEVSHTSGTFSTDLAAEKWSELADFNTLEVADSGITTAKIADLNVTTAKLAALAVTTAKIAAGAVTTTELADDAVTRAKIADAAMSGDDATLITGTAGTNGYLAAWNADGDLVDGAVAVADVLTTADEGSGNGIDADTVDGLEAATIDPRGKHSIYIPAGAMVAATTSGPVAGQSEMSSNKHNFLTLGFDASADEYACFEILMPSDWNEGTLTFQVLWTTTATDTDGVAWGLQAVAVADGDSSDVAYGTAVVVTDDAQSAASDVLITAESAAVTVAGSPAAGELTQFRVFRDVSDANDDMTEDALLRGVRVFYTTDAAVEV